MTSQDRDGNSRIDNGVDPTFAETDNDGDDDSDDQNDTIVTDRPSFTEASSTVGRGRIQLEAGYTFIHDNEGGTQRNFHSYPEMLWRIGMFADWFELRIAWNHANERLRTGGVSTTATGAEDLLLGVKLGLTEQKGVRPEMALIIQGTVPTGADAFSTDEVQPGVSLLYSWEVIKDFLTIGGQTMANRAVAGDDTLFGALAGIDPTVSPRHSYIEFSQSLTTGWSLTDRLGAFFEWFAFFPHSSIDPTVKPQYFLDAGFTYLITNNFQYDIRAGYGLNRAADDFFAGTGFAVRY